MSVDFGIRELEREAERGDPRGKLASQMHKLWVQREALPHGKRQKTIQEVFNVHLNLHVPADEREPHTCKYTHTPAHTSLTRTLMQNVQDQERDIRQVLS